MKLITEACEYVTGSDLQQEKSWCGNVKEFPIQWK